MRKVAYKDLGQIDYQKAWDYQQSLLKQVVDTKLTNRQLVKANQPTSQIPKNYLLFCEHPPVYTLGKSGSMEHLLLNTQELGTKGIQFHKINRGGDITYHGPGQVIGYPIFDLDQFFTDVHRYVRFLEEAVIRTLADFGVEGSRIKGFSGVWIAGKQGSPNRKICAVGVHLSRWVTMHGFALNVDTDLSFFNFIIPCGISDSNKTVTSLTKELGKSVDITIVKRQLKTHFSNIFDFTYEQDSIGN
jgi:lipoyl(octanoyl) transferase